MLNFTNVINQKLLIALSDQSLRCSLIDQVDSILLDNAKEVYTGVRTLRYILREKPDVAIIDYSFNDLDIFEIVKEVRQKKIKTKFIIVFKDVEYKDFFKVNSLNIHGCLCFNNAPGTFLACLETVVNDGIYVCDNIRKLHIQEGPLQNLKNLTTIEMSILTLVGLYQNASKISEKLHNSTASIEKHCSNIIAKLKLKEDKPSGLRQWAIKNREIIQILALQRVS